MVRSLSRFIVSYMQCARAIIENQSPQSGNFRRELLPLVCLNRPRETQRSALGRDPAPRLTSSPSPRNVRSTSTRFISPLRRLPGVFDV